MAVPALTDQDRALFADLRPRGRPPSSDPPERLAPFREALKRHREARRWSQERLAEEAEMDHSLISRLESGQRTPTRDAIGKLARGLELAAHTRDDLLMAAGYLSEGQAPGELQEAVALLRETTAGERAAALALIRAARRYGAGKG